MKLAVTQEHIDKGVKARAGKCAIALALLAAGFKTATVWADINVTNGAAQLVKSPDELLMFAQAFDRGDPCVPTVFDIPELKAPNAPEGPDNTIED